MIITTILALIGIALATVTATFAGIGGFVGLAVFGDVIVFALILGFLVKLLAKKRK